MASACMSGLLAVNGLLSFVVLLIVSAGCHNEDGHSVFGPNQKDPIICAQCLSVLSFCFIVIITVLQRRGADPVSSFGLSTLASLLWFALGAYLFVGIHTTKKSRKHDEFPGHVFDSGIAAGVLSCFLSLFWARRLCDGPEDDMKRFKRIRAAELDAHLTEDEDVPILSSSDNESSPYGSDAELGLRSAL